MKPKKKQLHNFQKHQNHKGKNKKKTVVHLETNSVFDWINLLNFNIGNLRILFCPSGNDPPF